MLREWEEQQKAASAAASQKSFFPKVDGWKKSAPGDVSLAGADDDNKSSDSESDG